MIRPDLSGLLEQAAVRGEPVGADALWARATQEASVGPAAAETVPRGRAMPSVAVAGLVLVVLLALGLGVRNYDLSATVTAETRTPSPFVPPGPGDLPVQRIAQLTFPDGHTEVVDGWLIPGTNGMLPTICIRAHGVGCSGFVPDLAEISLQSVTPAPPYRIVVVLVPSLTATVISVAAGTATTYVPVHAIASDGTEVGVTALLVDVLTETLDVSAVSTTGAVLDHRVVRVG